MKKLYYLIILILLVSCGNSETEDIEVNTIQNEHSDICTHVSKLKIGDYQLDEDGNLVISNRIKIHPAKVSDGNVRYSFIYDNEPTKIFTYHTAHKSIDKMVDFLCHEFNENYKGNIKPFIYK